MGQRRILVMGSQCSAAGRLSFLPDLAQELYRVMTDPELGQCVPALPEEQGGGLLLDPTVREVKAALRSVIQRASADQATLFLAYVGHGEAFLDDFYLLPLDADPAPREETAVHLIQLLRQEIG